MIKVGLVGLGRIGRHALRFILENYDDVELYFYDLNDNKENLAYLLNYDTVYGLRSERFTVGNSGEMNDTLSNCTICYHHLNEFEKLNLNFVIDCSGSLDVLSYLSDLGVKTYITNSPNSKLIDDYIIANVSDSSIGRIVSTSICDTTAIAPVVKFIDDNFGFSNAHLVTLHPWLGYQNLTDNSVISVDTPQSYHNDFALGRKSSEAMIPKSTSAISALGKVFPDIAAKFSSFSYRVPTPVVSSALLNFRVHSLDFTLPDLISHLGETNGIKIARPHMISSDFIGMAASCAVDQNSVKLNGDILSLALWYDNELGYTSNIVNYIFGDKK